MANRDLLMQTNRVIQTVSVCINSAFQTTPPSPIPYVPSLEVLWPATALFFLLSGYISHQRGIARALWLYVFPCRLLLLLQSPSRSLRLIFIPLYGWLRPKYLGLIGYFSRGGCVKH